MAPSTAAIPLPSAIFHFTSQLAPGARAQPTPRPMTSSPMALPATFYRGGTSKAVCLLASSLPPDRASWPALFLKLMGSPDPHGRQLNGMGGGISSVSKVIVVEPSAKADADVDYTFYQIGIKSSAVDTVSNCGNMASAVGPFALELGLVQPPRDTSPSAMVRLYNTNTSKIIHSRFPVTRASPPPLISPFSSVTPPPITVLPLLSGTFSIPGVSGTGARIDLDFVDPGGAKTGQLLPTGNAVDVISPDTVPGYTGPSVHASLIDCANPCVFVRASDVGLEGAILPSALEGRPDVLEHLEAVRRAATVLMGMAGCFGDAPRHASAPKIGIVSAVGRHATLSGETLGEQDADLMVRIVSAGDPHRAIPITAAICLAGAVSVPGTFVRSVWEKRRRASSVAGEVLVAHPSGVITLGAEVSRDAQGRVRVDRATLARTARKLMEGVVFVD